MARSWQRTRFRIDAINAKLDCARLRPARNRSELTAFAVTPFSAIRPCRLAGTACEGSNSTLLVRFEVPIVRKIRLPAPRTMTHWPVWRASVASGGHLTTCRPLEPLRPLQRLPGHGLPKERSKVRFNPIQYADTVQSGATPYDCAVGFPDPISRRLCNRLTFQSNACQSGEEQKSSQGTTPQILYKGSMFSANLAARLWSSLRFSASPSTLSPFSRKR